jgi:hypothetical protein
MVVSTKRNQPTNQRNAKALDHTATNLYAYGNVFLFIYLFLHFVILML